MALEVSLVPRAGPVDIVVADLASPRISRCLFSAQLSSKDIPNQCVWDNECYRESLLIKELWNHELCYDTLHHLLSPGGRAYSAV